MSDRKPIECHSMTMSGNEYYGVFKESEVRELEKQRDIAVEALKGIISCVENPLTSYQNIVEYSEKVSKTAINQAGEK